MLSSQLEKNSGHNQINFVLTLSPELTVCFLGNVLLSDSENKLSFISSVVFLFNRMMSSEFDNNQVDDNYSGDGDET